MSNTRRELELAARVLLINYAKAGATLTDAECVRAQQQMPRPEIDYLTVQAIAVGVPKGRAWATEAESGGLPTQAGRGYFGATISVRGYGPATLDWLERVVLCLALDSVTTTLDTAGYRGISFHALGGIRNLSALRGTGFEEQYGLDLAATYRATSSAVSGAPLETVGITATYEDENDPPGDLVSVATIDTT